MVPPVKCAYRPNPSANRTLTYMTSDGSVISFTHGRFFDAFIDEPIGRRARLPRLRHGSFRTHRLCRVTAMRSTAPSIHSRSELQLREIVKLSFRFLHIGGLP
jgi:hypothetical protein